MTENNHNNSIQDKVLKAIEDGKVQMRPRWQFVLVSVLMGIGLVLLFLTSLFVVSLIVFSIHQNGAIYVPGFGIHGVNLFLSSVPWLLVLVALLFIVLLQVLVKRYSFGYGKPLLFTALAIIAVAVVGGIAVERTPLHLTLFERAENEHLPIGGSIYKHYCCHGIEEVTIGKIVAIGDKTYQIETQEREIILVLLSDQTDIPANQTFKIGDVIVVVGDMEKHAIDAEGIRLFTGQRPSPKQLESERDEDGQREGIKLNYIFQSTETAYF